MFSTWRSVLLVEDEPILRELVEQALLRANHRVTSVGNAAEARVAWGREHFDVIVTDFSLEDGTTGVELVQEFRENGSEVPVLVMTGYDVDTLKDDWAHVSGHVTFLQKPFRMDDLIEAVENTPTPTPKLADERMMMPWISLSGSGNKGTSPEIMA